MTSRLTSVLRAAPATLPALGAVALFAVWAGSEAGYPLTHWAPGALVVLALLAIALAATRPRWRDIPLPARIAVSCLAAFTALSFLSILWAGVPGDAWEGADRTLLYLLVFALFACWPQRGASAALLLCLWTLALVGLAAFAVLHVDAAAGSARRLQALLPGGRLVYPAGYVNAAAAQWMMALWPALLLARSRELPAWLRGALAGGAVLLAGVALLSQSRGALYSTPIVLALVFALLPGRVRTFAVLVPIAAGIGAATPAVLRVSELLEDGRPATAAVHGATLAIFAAAVAVGLVVALGAAIERRRGPLPSAAGGRLHRLVGAVALGALVVVLAGGWAAAGNPVTRARHAWDTFKSPKGYEANSTGGSRLTSGLGSERYDFYRVALDEFAAHPLLGIGADNFAEAYLAHGRSTETPHYPHSVELRTLAETGILGALLALVGLGAALLACARAIARSSDRLGRAVAAAAVAGFAYWAVHGSFDWFWEFAGLGAPAFALLGLGCALAPPSAGPGGQGESEAAEADQGSGRGAGYLAARAGRSRARLAFVLGGGVLAGTAVVALAAPWLSALEVQSAARVWIRQPALAYARLEHAAALDPLDDEPYVVAASIALRRGELGRADHYFALALRRTPGEAYATLERGAIASAQGRRLSAQTLLVRAVQLDPRNPLTREALAVVRRGGRVDIARLNLSILDKAQQFA
ncbi:MAG TPA: O-antigen ligase family protein [Solirubrobacteraceae bacterium]|nr:O-antigen ligase family protein [Solirubrobacteraceae bacterium]